MTRKLLYLIPVAVLLVVAAYIHLGGAKAAGVVGDNTIVQRVGSQSIPHGITTRIYWNTQLRDDDDWYNGTAPGAIRVRYSGKYIVTVQSNWVNNDVGTRSVHLQRDASATHPIQVLTGTNTRTPKWGAAMSLAWTGYLDAGDVLSFYVYQTSGVTLGFGGQVRLPGTGSGNAELGITRIG